MDEVAPEMVPGEQSCERCENRSVDGLEHRSMHLTSQDGHFMAQHQDFNGEICVAAPREDPLTLRIDLD